MYINDLHIVVKHAQVSLYADDTVLYYFSSTPSDLEGKLNSDLQDVCRWLLENKLTLNIKKTKFMVIVGSRKRPNIDSISIKVNDNEVERVEGCLYLGVTFSCNMTWTEHADKLCSNINKRMGLWKRIKHLNYCNLFI